MGDSGLDWAAQRAAQQNLSMSESMYGTALTAQRAGTAYTTGAYEMGGFDQSAKYQAMQSGILDAAARQGPGDFLHPETMGGNAAMRAEGISNVGAQKITAGMDELNKIRATLAGNGLQSTNFAAEEGALGNKALGMMDEDPTGSTVKAIGGLGAAVYGGGKKAGWWGQPSKPAGGSQFGFGLQGSDVSNWATTPITSLTPPGQLSLYGK